MRPPRARATACVLAAAGVVASASSCSHADSPGLVAPNNDCNEHACSAYVQAPPTPQCDATGNFCHVNAPLDFSLVVTMPATSQFAPGATFVVRFKDLARLSNSAACPKDANATCVVLPGLGASSGAYDVERAVTKVVGFAPEGFGNGAQFTSLPVVTMFAPLAPPGDSPTSHLADSDGYPAPTLFGTATTNLPTPPGSPGVPIGPFGTAPIGWSATLPFGRYLRTIVPAPPFDSFFPPRRDEITVAGNTVEQPQAQLDDPAAAYTITSESTDLEGFTAELDDTNTHHALSRIARLHTGSNDVPLHTIGGVAPIQDKPIELVVAPPPGSDGVPSLVVQAAPIIPAVEQYPTVPPPATVAGRVVGNPEGTPVRATIVLESVPEPGALAATIGGVPANVLLRYKTVVQADEEGKWQALLPPGRYDVEVTPDPLSGYAQFASTAGASGQLVVASDEPFQRGKSITVAHPASMHGTAALADDTPLADADVEARPSTDPAVVTSAYFRDARVGHGHTDANGAFTIPLDPGFYDVFVMPKDGTRLPWIVTRDRRIDGTDVSLEKLVVPAPVHVGVTLLAQPTAQAVFPVQGAFVRAFGVVGAGPAVEIGRATVGTRGELELFLAGGSK